MTRERTAEKRSGRTGPLRSCRSELLDSGASSPDGIEDEEEKEKEVKKLSIASSIALRSYVARLKVGLVCLKFFQRSPVKNGNGSRGKKVTLSGT